MEIELVELFEVTTKAADAAASEGVSSNGPEVVRCVDALKQLKKFPVTYDILVSTQVIKFPYLYMPLNFNSLPFFHV